MASAKPIAISRRSWSITSSRSDSRYVRLQTDQGVRSIERADVARFETKGDSVRNGALIGAATALAVSPLALQGYNNKREWARDMPLNMALFAA